MSPNSPESLAASAPKGMDSCDTGPQRLAGLESLIARLYAESGAAEYGIKDEVFRDILTEVAEAYSSPEDGQNELRELLMSLRVSDLALARACVAGNEKAWEALLARYREPLYEIAAAIAKNDGLGKELADSLYGDLYGIGDRKSSRPSKLKSYTGMGSLIGWLRTVLAQSYIDWLRKEQRLVSLDQDDDDDEKPSAQGILREAPDLPITHDPRIDQMTAAALKSMAAEDRFILASYYIDNRTLNEIASSLGVHESTISRKVEKIVRKLRKNIRLGLLKLGMSATQAEEALATDVTELHVNVSAALQAKENAQEPVAESFLEQKVSGASASQDLGTEATKEK